MMKRIKEMTWDMHFLHLVFLVLGAFTLIVFVIHRDNPKLGMDPFLLLIPAIGLMGGGIASFLMCLFECLRKERGNTKTPAPFSNRKIMS